MPTDRELMQQALDALEWILPDRKSPGGFLWACDVLDINPDRVRAEFF